MFDEKLRKSPGTVTTTTFDAVPEFCIVCGAPATGCVPRQISEPYRPPIELLSKLLAMVQPILFFWAQSLPDSARPPRRAGKKFVHLPHCNKHNRADIEQAVSISTFDGHTIKIRGASATYCEALRVLQEPPSLEFLATLDRGPTDDFVSAIQDCEGFLKELEEESSGEDA